jgi:hypothetical protein
MNNTPESGPALTIGMPVAFQMFASRLSQSMLELLWNYWWGGTTGTTRWNYWELLGTEPN